MPFDPPDYVMHRALIEQARKKRREKKPSAKARKLAEWLRYHGYTISDVRSELMRMIHQKRQAKMSPEARKEAKEIVAARKRIHRASCDHSKLPPKLRASGPRKGEWVCPSCHGVVPAPFNAEGLEIVR